MTPTNTDFCHKTLNQTSFDLPHVCLNDTDLENILHESLEWEAEIIPDIKEEDEQEHREGFWNAVAKKKFCDVDTKAVLAIPEWKKFFQQYAS